MRLSFALLILSFVAYAQIELFSLDGWRSNVGDDPRWAQREFDDSTWQVGSFRVNSRPAERIERDVQIEWFRLAVAIPAAWVDQKLAIGMGPAEDAYQIFVNGSMIGHFGSFPLPGRQAADADVIAFTSRHKSFAIAQELVQGSGLQIAVRLWKLRATNRFAFHTSFGAGSNPMRHVPVIGPASSVAQKEELDLLQGLLWSLPNMPLWTLTFFGGAFCLMLYRRRTTEREYLWLGLALGLTGIYYLIGLPGGWLEWIPKTSLWSMAWGFGIGVSSYYFFCLFLAELVPTMRRLIRIATLLIALISGLWLVATYVPSLDHEFASHLRNATSSLIAALGLSAGLLSLRRGAADLAILCFCVVLRYLTIMVTTVDNAYNRINIGPTFVSLRILGDAVVAVALVWVLYTRFKKTWRRQREVELDLAAARRVQEMMLGNDAPTISGLCVEIAYRSARQVGGDFYYLAPHQDGSLLIVIGDVSGKGLPAAMLVSSIIGSLRNESSRSPGQVFANLNRSLLGRTGGGVASSLAAAPD